VSVNLSVDIQTHMLYSPYRTHIKNMLKTKVYQNSKFENLKT